MIVPFAPGGASDFVGRIIQTRLGEELGQQVVIDNRTGASGNIGVEIAARATADGYTILLGNSGTMVESGFPAMTTGAWQGLFAPAGTPRPIITKLFAAVGKTMSDPEVGQRLATGSAEIITSKSPEEFAKFVKAETDLWVKVIKDIGVVGE